MRLPTGLPRPDVILQDELHLITGPLGTMAGLYETAISAHSCNNDGTGPKIIASTATARGARAQVPALYGRPEVAIFPPPGLEPEETFFARPDPHPASTRRYLGVAAPGRNIKAVEVRVLSALLCAAYKSWRRRPDPTFENPADPYMTVLA